MSDLPGEVLLDRRVLPESWSQLLKLGSEPGGVLKDAFGAGVMDELVAAHQALPHEDFAPSAEAIR